MKTQNKSQINQRIFISSIRIIIIESAMSGICHSWDRISFQQD